MPRQRPRQTENERKEKRILRDEERSIASFAATTRDFERVTNQLADVVSSFKTVVSDFGKENKRTSNQPRSKPSGGGRGDNTGKSDSRARKSAFKRQQAEISKFEKDADRFGFKRLQNFTNDVFGKRTAQKMTRSMARFTGYIGGGKAGGGKGFGGAMMGRAAGGLGSMAGGLLRAAGPVGAIIGGLKMAFDFWDSGGFAKLTAGIKMATKKGSMFGPEGVASMRESLEGTEAFRAIDAKYAYVKPLELRQAVTQDYFNWEKQSSMDMLQYQQGLVKDDVEFEMGLRRDAITFRHQQAMETLDAEMSKRKDIAASGMSFISQYAKVSERALKAIGSSTKAIIEGISKFQSVFGLSVKGSFQLSENAQGLAYHFGVGADDVMNMTNLFRLMGKTSAKTAQSLIGGITQFAKLNDLAPQAIFAQIKDAGEDIYKFSSGTAENFVKQASLLTKMSVSMSQMMKASDTMVLNYKDSIKAEMSLSAMLGKNVNLSEVRARLMQGDQAGAASALKTALGGTDINAMNAFQKQALQQATGMDISALMGLQQGKAAGGLKGGLNEQANAGKAFADGALKQDIANAGAKLALEQQQRKELLQFEQKQRLVMLMLEQQQRLDSIKLEAAYRAEWELKYAKEFEKEGKAAEALAEVGTNILASRGTAMMDQIFAAQGITGVGADTKNLIANQLATLQKSGYIQSGDMAAFAPKLMDALQGVKDMKDGKAVEAAMKSALNTSFGPQLEKYQAAVNAKVETRIKAAEEFAAAKTAGLGGNWRRVDADIASITKKYNLSDEEAKAAMGMTKSVMHEKRGQGTKNFVVDPKMVDELRKANDIGIQSKVAEAGNKVVVAEVKANGQKTIDAQNKIAVQQMRELSEAEYNTKLQQEMVAMLGLSAQLLGEITYNTKGDREIVLDGRTLRKNLLEQSRRNYGVSRTVAVS